MIEYVNVENYGICHGYITNISMLWFSTLQWDIRYEIGRDEKLNSRSYITTVNFNSIQFFKL